MSTTFIRKACPKCGHSVSTAVRNYVGEPIGQPLSVCPNCGAIAWDSEHREWIQMSPVRKFYAILPKGIWYAPAITAGLTITAIVLFRDAIDKLLSNTSGSGSGVGFLVFLYFAGVSLIVYYLLAWAAVNGDRFPDLYRESILRTRNETYRKLLEKEGDIYDEKLPFGIKFDVETQKKIDEELKKAKPEDGIHIPSLDFSIY